MIFFSLSSLFSMLNDFFTADNPANIVALTFSNILSNICTSFAVHHKYFHSQTGQPFCGKARQVPRSKDHRLSSWHRCRGLIAAPSDIFQSRQGADNHREWRNVRRDRVCIGDFVWNYSYGIFIYIGRSLLLGTITVCTLHRHDPAIFFVFTRHNTHVPVFCW